MIQIYDVNNTNFDNNGDVTLDPITCKSKKVLNGENSLVLEHAIDNDGRYKYIKADNVISVNKQLYRIHETESNLGTITAYALPIFYDLIDKIILDKRPTNTTGQEALSQLLEGTRFKGYSDILAINTAYYQEKNIIECISSSDDNSFLNRWGGELYCDNFNIYINHKIGGDKGLTINYGYNLEEIEENIDYKTVVTRIIPRGYDGVGLDGSTPWIDSPLINKYSNIKEKVIKFSDVKVGDDGFVTIDAARQELIKRSNKLFEEGIDKPSIFMKISMVDLANVEEYKEFKHLFEIDLGDTVYCKVKHLDIDVSTRVVSVEKEELTGEILNLELGTIKGDISNTLGDVKRGIEQITNSNGTVKSERLEGVINAMQTQFKALKDVAQKQDVRAILFEDKDINSPTFGCMCMGTMGFEIAGKFKPGTTEWDFRTFGTGQGFVADYITAGILSSILIQSLDGTFRIDLKESGGAKFFNYGKLAMEMAKNSLRFYSWFEAADYIGNIGAYRREEANGIGKPIIALNNDINSALMLGRETADQTGKIHPYITLDYYKVLNDPGKEIPIRFNYPFFAPNGWYNHDKTIKFALTDSGVALFKNNNLMFSVNESTGLKVASTAKLNIDEGTKFSVKKIDEASKDSITGKVYNVDTGELLHPTSSGGGTGEEVVNQARRLIGLPYSQEYFNYLTREIPPFCDCSSLCQWSYYQIGITLTRTTYTQIGEGVEITNLSDLRPGDLVFTNFSSPGVPEHVYMYSKYENGQHYCVEAATWGINARERVFPIGESGEMKVRRIL